MIRARSAAVVGLGLVGVALATALAFELVLTRPPVDSRSDAAAQKSPADRVSGRGPAPQPLPLPQGEGAEGRASGRFPPERGERAAAAPDLDPRTGKSLIVDWIVAPAVERPGARLREPTAAPSPAVTRVPALVHNRPLRMSYRTRTPGTGPGGAPLPPPSTEVQAYLAAVRAVRERFEGGLDLIRVATADHLAGLSSWERAAVTADATSQLAASLARDLASLEVPAEAVTHRRALVDVLRRGAETSLAYGPGESQAYVASVRVVDEVTELLNAYFLIPDDPRAVRASLDGVAR